MNKLSELVWGVCDEVMWDSMMQGEVVVGEVVWGSVMQGGVVVGSMIQGGVLVVWLGEGLGGASSISLEHVVKHRQVR